MLAMTLAMPCQAFAAGALLDTRMDGAAGAAAYSVSIPVIDQSGSNLTADRMKALIGSGSPAELVAVRAERISIPSLTVTATGPEAMAGHILSLTDIVLDDVGDGRAAAVAIGSIVLRTPWGASRLDNVAARNVNGAAQLFRHGMSPGQRPGITVEDVSLDIPHPAYPGRRVSVGILNLDASLAAFRNGIPTSFDVEGMGVTFDLPADPDNPVLAILRAAGLVRIDGTFRLAAEWNEGQDTISLLEASVTGRELGGVFLAGEITRAGEALFSTHPAEAWAAFSGLAVRFVTASVLDSGLRDRLAASIVKTDSGNAGERRAALARIAARAVMDALNPSDDAGAVGAAVERFIAEGSKGIDVTVQAKTEPGIAMIDLPGIGGNPPAFLQSVRIDAEVK